MLTCFALQNWSTQLQTKSVHQNATNCVLMIYHPLISYKASKILCISTIAVGDYSTNVWHTFQFVQQNKNCLAWKLNSQVIYINEILHCHAILYTATSNPTNIVKTALKSSVFSSKLYYVISLSILFLFLLKYFVSLQHLLKKIRF